MARSRGITAVPDLTTIDFPEFNSTPWALNPSVTAGAGTFTLTNVEHQSYCKIGNICIVFLDFWGTFSGVDSSTYIGVDAPITPINDTPFLSGVGVFTHSTTTAYPLMFAISSGRIQIYMNNYRDDVFTTTAGRYIRGNLIYEVAA